MSHWYYATSQKPTAVTHAVVGELAGPGQYALVLGKTSRIEVHSITAEGLQPILDVPINGRIATLKTFRALPDKRDHIVVTTERCQFIVLELDARDSVLRTIATGDLRDRIGRRLGRGMFCAVDPASRCIALQMYQGLLKIVPYSSSRGFGTSAAAAAASDAAATTGVSGKAFNIRLDEIDVLDIAFLHGHSNPVLAVLYRDSVESLHVRTYDISLRAEAASDGPLRVNHLQAGSSMLIAPPVGGVLVVAREKVSYHTSSSSSSGGSSRRGASAASSSSAAAAAAAAMDDSVDPVSYAEPIIPRCFGVIDERRYLLADAAGGLSVISLQGDRLSGAAASGGGAAASGAVTGLRVDKLGVTTLASAVTYVDSGYVFVASTLGDSQLIKLHAGAGAGGAAAADAGSAGTHFDVVSSFPNLGPIVDFTVMDLDRQGQGQVVTCSGSYKEGSLRVVRNGIGIDMQAEVELPGIRGIWSLRDATAAEHDKYLVQSFAAETRVFIIDGSDMSEGELAGVRADAPSVHCATLAADRLIQVTPTEVRLLKAAGGSLVSSWSPSGGARITLGASHGSRVLVAAAGGGLTLLQLSADGAALTAAATAQMPHEISSVTLNVLPAAAEAMADAGEVVAAVGLWSDNSIRVLRLPALTEVAKELVGGDIPSRSILLQALEGVPYLFAGLGDGYLLSYKVDTAGGSLALTERRKVQIGRQPISLTPFRIKSSLYVFAACDRPTVLHCMGRGKLVYSNVNLSDVTGMAPFHSAAFPDCLALTSAASLTIGTVDEIQKLHVRTIPLGEQPRRVCHTKAGRAVVVATEGAKATASGDAVESANLRLFDDATFSELSLFELDPHELCLSLSCMTLGSDSDGSGGSGGAASSSSGSAAAAAAEAAPVGAAEYIVVGTAYILADEEEPSRGRILVLRVSGADSERKLSIVAVREVRGGVMALAPMAGGKLVTGINSRVVLYRFGVPSKKSAKASGGAGAGSGGSGADTDLALEPECTFHSHTIAMYLDSRGDYVLVGDLMRSVSLLRYDAVSKTLQEAAAEPSTNWMTAVAMLPGDSNAFLGAEHFFNIFIATRNMSADVESNFKLDITADFHTGEFINRFRQGSLVMLPQEAGVEGAAAAASSGRAGAGAGTEEPSAKRARTGAASDAGAAASSSSSSSAAAAAAAASSGPLPRIVFGTVSGALGALISLPPAQYATLAKLQRAIAKSVTPLGGLSHAAYRSWYSESAFPLPAASAAAAAAEEASGAPRGILDGDLLESFLDMDADSQQAIVAAMVGSSSKAKAVAASSGSAAAAAAAGPAASAAAVAEQLDSVLKMLEDLTRLH